MIDKDENEEYFIVDGLRKYETKGGWTMNGYLLKAEIISRGMTVESYCKEAGFARSTFDRKLRGKYEFDRAEIERIKVVLELSDEKLRTIFFSSEVA